MKIRSKFIALRYAKQVLSLLLLTCVLSVVGHGQVDRFDGLVSEGSIPTDLKLSLDELYNQDKQRVRDYNDGKLTNRDNVLAASYHINQLMKGGRILYGDPITRMVERIADTLLHEYPALRKELRFYTVKSPEVNAFATGQGMIFVNIGLVAQVEDESQLAFIVGHEIIHYFKKHNLEILSRKKGHKDNDVEEQQLRDFLKRHNRSHQMENEADSLGLVLFYIDSPYDKAVSDGVFDVLQYGHLPFDEVPFDTNYFNTPYYRLAGGCYLSKVAPITARDDYDDSKSSHPNLLKRRERATKMLANYHGGQKFVTTTQEEFAEIQQLARYECIRQNLIYANYVRAFYDAYLLSHYNPEDPFLVEAKAQSLYALSKYRTHTNSNLAVGNHKEFEGEIQQVYYLFSHLNGDEMALIALREVWNAHLKYPKEERFIRMAEELATDLEQKYGLGRSAFSAVYDTTTKAVDTVRQSARNQKYERIKQKRRNQQTTDTRRFAFTDFMMADASFGEMLQHASEHTSARASTTVRDFNPRKNILLYSPAYYVVDKDNYEIKYRKSDRLESLLSDQLNEVMGKKKFGTIAITDKSLKERNNADEYNEYVAFNEWCDEFWQTQGEYGISLFTQPKMNSLMEKYDANLLNITQVLNAEYYQPDWGVSTLLWTCLVVPTLPVSIYSLAANKERSNVMTLMVDAKNGKVISKRGYETNNRDTKAFAKQSLYDNLNRACGQMEAKKREPVSGYMGRRFLFSVHGALGLNRLGFKEGSGRRFIGLADSALLRPSLSFTGEFVLSPDQSIAFGYRRNKVNTDQTEFVGIRSYSGGVSMAEYAPIMVEETTHNFTLTYRNYFNRTAPIGAYWGAGIVYSRLNLNQPESLKLRLEDTGKKLPLNRFGIQFELGRNYIYFDYLLLNIDIKYSLIFANPMKEKFGSFDEYQGFEKDLHRLNADLMVNNAILITLGLGMIPF